MVPLRLIPPRVCYTGVSVSAAASSMYVPRETFVSGSLNFVKKELLERGSADRSRGRAKVRSLDVAQSPGVLKGLKLIRSDQSPWAEMMKCPFQCLPCKQRLRCQCTWVWPGVVGLLLGRLEFKDVTFGQLEGLGCQVLSHGQRRNDFSFLGTVLRNAGTPCHTFA